MAGPVHLRDITGDVATIRVVPFHEVVLFGGSFVLGDDVASVSARRHRRSDEFRAHQRRLRVLEIKLQIVDPVQVNVPVSTTGFGIFRSWKKRNRRRRLNS